MEQDFTAAVLMTESIVRSPTVVPRSKDDYPRTFDVVSEWHAEAGHIGRFDHCDQQPCRAIERARSV